MFIACNYEFDGGLVDLELVSTFLFRSKCVKIKNEKVNMTPKQEKIDRPMIKSIWVRKAYLHAYDDLKYDTLDDTVESRDFGLAL